MLLRKKKRKKKDHIRKTRESLSRKSFPEKNEILNEMKYKK